ncbi:UNVERIFIED_CONTAM: hypothetical protein HDU68_005197, partial [Siphonaria sp. JEL0065]
DTMGGRVKAVQVKEDRKAKLEERKRLLLERKKKKEGTGIRVSENIGGGEEGNNDGEDDADAFLQQFV